MKKILTIILFLVAGTSYAQPGCPTGQQNQLAKWKFLFSQCFDDTVFLNYAATKQVAYVDANGVLTTIPFLQLRDSLNIPEPSGNQWNIQFNDSGEFASSLDFNYDADEGIFYVLDFNADTLFSVNTQTRETRSRGTFSLNLPDSTGAIIDGNGNVVADSIGWAWKGNGWYLLNRYNAPTASGSLIISSTSGSNGQIVNYTASNIGAQAPQLSFYRARGTLAAPTVPLANTVLGHIAFLGNTGTPGSFGGSSGIFGIAGGSFTSTIVTPIFLRFTTQDANGVPFSSVFTQKGTFAIKGTNVDTLSELTIRGTEVSGATDYNAIRILQTWNTTGNPTGIFANYTNTASGATSKLIDLQTDGTTRFNVLKTGEATFASLVNATTFVSTTSGNGFIISGGGRLKAPDGNGIFELTNTTENGFIRINFGDNTSSFPSLKRNGAGLQVRTGDDSGFGTLEAGNTTINSVLTLTPITATAASAITPAFGMMVVVNNTNGTFTSTGLWFYNGAAWVFIIG